MLVKPVPVSELFRLVTLEGIVMLVKLVSSRNALLPRLVTPQGIVSAPCTVAGPVIVMLVPELVNVRLSGIHTAYRVTLAVPMVNVAAAA